MTGGTSAAWDTIVANVVRVAEAMVHPAPATGAFIHLDIEPEPDCLIETTDEIIDFFDAAPAAGRRRRRSPRPLGAPSRRHGPSSAITSESVSTAAISRWSTRIRLRRWTVSGTPACTIGRVQLSSALRVSFPENAAEANALAERLRHFADSTYLHQVIARRGRRPPSLRRSRRSAADAGTRWPDREWRIHFHVPLFTAEYDGLGSTQDYVRAILELASADGDSPRHLEIETYTWDVLPAGLKIDLLDSIGREYEWVLQHFK